MLTKFKRVLLRDGKFGYLVRQVVDGATPLYLVTTVHWLPVDHRGRGFQRHGVGWG